MTSSIATRARVVVVVVALLLAPGASAQNLTREATAQALFEEATALFERGAWDQACAKFLASDELDPRGGTLLNLALCLEKQGRTASAWSTFNAARNRSLKEGRAERVAFAEKKVAELRPRLPRLRVVVAEAGVQVQVDGQPLPAAAWDTGVPVDPGEHRIEASAPARRPFVAVVRATDGAEVTTTVPALRREAVVVTREVPSSGTPTWIGWTVLGAGVASVGVGSIFGVQALSKRSDAESLCASGRCAEGRAANDDGIRAGWISNVGIGVGLVAALAGIYLLVRTPTPPRTAQSTPAP